MQRPEELGLDKDWVSASSTHNYSEQNTLVDWLNLHGKEFGFIPDGQRPDHDQRFSYVSALLRQSWTFERLVSDWLATLTRFAGSPMVPATPGFSSDGRKPRRR